jgi:hypothetical protein
MAAEQLSNFMLAAFTLTRRLGQSPLLAQRDVSELFDGSKIPRAIKAAGPPFLLARQSCGEGWFSGSHSSSGTARHPPVGRRQQHTKGDSYNSLGLLSITVSYKLAGSESSCPELLISASEGTPKASLMAD